MLATPRLFLGFASDSVFEGELSRSNSYWIKLLIGKEEYLTPIAHQGKNYLGKFLPSFPTLEQMEDLQKHLLSLLHKLAPHYPFENNLPCLLTLLTR